MPTDRRPASLEVTGLCFSYSGEQVLRNVSFRVLPGERLAIVGRNGAGKTTLLRCLVGLEKAHGGTVAVQGREVDSYSARSLAQVVAYVPQVANRSVPYTAFEYAMMGRFPYQSFLASPSIEDRHAVEEALDLTDTADFRDRPMNTLSGGEAQRVLLAGAVSQRTPILFLDEPAVFLDPHHHELIQVALDKIHSELGVTIATVTHDINTALSCYDRILGLAEGETCYFGEPREVLQHHRDILRKIYGVPFEVGTCRRAGRRFVFPQRPD